MYYGSKPDFPNLVKRYEELMPQLGTNMDSKARSELLKLKGDFHKCIRENPEAQKYYDYIDKELK